MDYAVILAGGAGERFWPASTPARPKQLLPLLSDRTMLRETVDRLEGVVPPERWWVFTNASLAQAIATELPEIPDDNIVAEPVGKNTAPAVGLAAGTLAADDPDAVMLVLPADHAIGNVEAFQRTIGEACTLAAERSSLILFGVVPSRPETGYGYIARGAPVAAGGVEAYEIAGFREKPDTAVARSIWRDGGHFWNSGLFCGRADVFLEEYAEHLPLMRGTIGSAVAIWDDDRATALAGFYAAVESTSIDVGIMQQTRRGIVVPASDWGWDDVGSWEALARWVTPSADGNVSVGRVCTRECRDVIAYAEDGRISALGVEGVVIVRTAGETLVVNRAELDGLKAFVRDLDESAS